MSKGKKGGKAQPESVVWDEPLVNEVTEDVSYRAAAAWIIAIVFFSFIFLYMRF